MKASDETTRQPGSVGRDILKAVDDRCGAGMWRNQHVRSRRLVASGLAPSGRRHSRL